MQNQIENENYAYESWKQDRKYQESQITTIDAIRNAAHGLGVDLDHAFYTIRILNVRQTERNQTFND